MVYRHQGGELALVVAKGGVDVGITSSFLLPMVGSMTIITTFITPYMVKIGWKIADTLGISNNNVNNNNEKPCDGLVYLNFLKESDNKKKKNSQQHDWLVISTIFTLQSCVI